MINDTRPEPHAVVNLSTLAPSDSAAIIFAAVSFLRADGCDLCCAHGCEPDCHEDAARKALFAAILAAWLA